MPSRRISENKKNKKKEKENENENKKSGNKRIKILNERNLKIAIN